MNTNSGRKQHNFVFMFEIFLGISSHKSLLLQHLQLTISSKMRTAGVSEHKCGQSEGILHLKIRFRTSSASCITSCTVFLLLKFVNGHKNVISFCIWSEKLHFNKLFQHFLFSTQCWSNIWSWQDGKWEYFMLIKYWCYERERDGVILFRFTILSRTCKLFLKWLPHYPPPAPPPAPPPPAAGWWWMNKRGNFIKQWFNILSCVVTNHIDSPTVI